MFQLFVLLLLIAQQAWSANILIVGLTLSHSHHHWIEAIAVGLVDKGHNVTFLSYDSTNIRHANYTVITLEGVYGTFDMYTLHHEESLTLLSIPSRVDEMWDISVEICERAIQHPTLHRTLLTYPGDFHFDVVLWDETMGECAYPLLELFGNPPVVGLSPYSLSSSVNDIHGVHIYSYIAYLVMPFSQATELYQRLQNILYTLYDIHRRRNYYKMKSVEVSQKVFTTWDAKKYEEVEDRIDVVLLNWHPAVNPAQPLSPGMIPVGGVQIQSGDALPQELEEIFRTPSSGVIFFSLGSNAKSEHLATSTLRTFTSCFGNLTEYEVIWKIEPPEDLVLPANVHATSWAPQTALLAKPTTKLFITHGGGLSMHEATFFGVPIVGMPIYLDQEHNIDGVRARGGGELLHLPSNHTSDLFCATVKKVLRTPSYGLSMQHLSRVYQDQPASPLHTAIYWVEFIIRHGHAKHLVPPSKHLHCFYTQNLDIYLVVLAFLFVPLYLLRALMRWLWKQAFQPTTKDKLA